MFQTCFKSAVVSTIISKEEGTKNCGFTLESLFGPHVNAKGYNLSFNAKLFKGASLAVTLCLYEKKKKRRKKEEKKEDEKEDEDEEEKEDEEDEEDEEE